MSINRFIFFIWFFALFVVTGFLVAEYRFFKNQVQELGNLKEDYALYIFELKKLVENTKEQIAEPEENSKKKKARKSVEPSFLVVNREPKYLKKSALTFAKKHKVEDELQQLYEDKNDFSVKKKKINKTSNSRIRNKLAEYAIATKRKKLKRESIFVWPIEKRFFKISSFFGPRKKRNGRWEFHGGIDMAASTGTPIFAAADGIVIESGYAKGFGNTIRISHNERFITRYAHLSVIGVKVGQRVRQYEEIGKVGATGNVRKSWRGGDASHLHFEVHDFGRRVNPFYLLG